MSYFLRRGNVRDKKKLGASHSDTPSDDGDNRWQWLAGLLIFLGVLILLSSMRQRPARRIGADGIPRDLNEKIDRHLKAVDLEERLHRAAAEQANEAFSEQSSRLAPAESMQYHPQPLRIKQERREGAIAQKQREDALPSDYRVQTMDQQIYRGMALDQWLQDYDEKYREEYVKAFIENARRAGYAVKVNKRLEVTDVRPIPDDALRLPNSVTGTGSANK